MELQIKGGIKHPIDFMSEDEKNLIQTIGTVIRSDRDITRHTEIKIIPYLELRIKDITNYYKTCVYDENVKANNESMYFVETYCDDSIYWEDPKQRKRINDLLA